MAATPTRLRSAAARVSSDLFVNMPGWQSPCFAFFSYANALFAPLSASDIASSCRLEHSLSALDLASSTSPSPFAALVLGGFYARQVSSPPRCSLLFYIQSSSFTFFLIKAHSLWSSVLLQQPLTCLPKRSRVPIYRSLARHQYARFGSLARLVCSYNMKTVCQQPLMNFPALPSGVREAVAQLCKRHLLSLAWSPLASQLTRQQNNHCLLFFIADPIALLSTSVRCHL